MRTVESMQVQVKRMHNTTTYGLSQFDYIVRNGNTVNEDDILFK